MDLQFFFDNTSDLYIILDQEFRITKVNSTFKSSLGFTEQEVIGKNISDFIFPEDSHQVDSFKSEVNFQDKVYSVRVLTKDGKVKWMEWKIKREGDLILVSSCDFSSQKEPQDELLQQNRQLEEEKVKMDALLADIGDGVIGVSEGGEITFVNNQTLNLLGYSQEELMGKMYVHILILEDEKGEEVPIQEVPIHKALLNKVKVSEGRLSFLKKDGSKLAVAITATPIILHDLIIGGVVIFRDITKEREVDRMKTEFISLASHQLRTPLSAMKWFSELLLDGGGTLTDEQRNLIENIYKSNERMIELVNALLNISRIESGRIIIEPVPTDLSALVNEVVTELQPKFNDKKHHLVISVHESLPLINIDPKLICHVYMNLLTNAIKYTHEGGEIDVLISKMNDEVISQVTDNGYGIPLVEQRKVFQKFFRANNIIKIETDGTGLGLYLIKSIIDSSGGKIWFKSEEGKGTTFWFSLPISGSLAKKGEVTIEDQKS